MKNEKVWIIATKFGQVGVCDTRNTAFYFMNEILEDWGYKPETEKTDSPSIFDLLKEDFEKNKSSFCAAFDDDCLIWATETDFVTTNDYKEGKNE